MRPILVLSCLPLLVCSACNDTKLVSAPLPPDEIPCGLSSAAVAGVVSRPEAAYHAPPLLAFGGGISALDLALAMDLDAASVVSAAVTGDPRQRAVFPGLGTVPPTAGATMAWLSTGA